MITKLDQYSWAKELETGNAQFVKLPDGTLYIVSNVLAEGPDAGKFKVLRSDPVPPAPGPGNSFTEVAFGTLANTTIDFDPVVSYDALTGLLHIVGTVDNPSINPSLTDLAKFTYDTTYIGPYPLDITSSSVTLIQGTSIQYAYDIVGLDNSIVSTGGTGHKLVAAGVSNPIAPPLFQTSVTNIAISQATLTVTCNNLFSVGQLIALDGFTGGDATFLNGAQVQITTASPTQFTALYYYRTIKESHTVPALPGPYVVTVTDASHWESDLGVVYTATGLPLTAVPSNPQVGEYSVANGDYTFNAGDQTKGVLISYEKFYSQAQTSGTATPLFSGQSLIAFELDQNDAVVANSLKVITNSPERTGNVVSSVSLVSTDGVDVNIFYESHPKLISFQDQVFNLYQINLKQTLITETRTIPAIAPYTLTANNSLIYQRDAGVIYAPAGPAFTPVVTPISAGQYSLSGATYTFDVADAGKNVIISYYVTTYTWDVAPTQLTQVQARFTDERLTVFADATGNLYLSQIFYSQFNHPEGLVGSALLGYQPVNGSWIFHPTYGSTLTGSIVQGVITVSQTAGVNFMYLLQPFQQVPPPIRLAGSYPLHVGAVDTATMSFTDVPGFYNQQNFTWLRGSKSVIDDASLWAGVGEQLSLLDVVGEVQLIPAVKPYALLVNHASTFWQDAGVQDLSGSTPVNFTTAINNPAKGQYTVQANGLYTFNALDASVGITGLDLTNNQITVTGTNISNLRMGQTVLFGGLTTSTYLNGVQASVTSIDLTRSTFTANFVHADDPEHAETGLVGKPIAISYNYVNKILPTYISLFNVPPVASMTPSYPTVVTVYRNQPSLFDGSASSDGDQDPLTFIWTESDPDVANVTITGNVSLASLKVAPGIGGNNQAHITNVSLTANVVTFSAVNTFNVGDIVLVKNLTNATFLNNQVLTVASSDGLHFTATFTHADYLSFADSGDAGVYRYFNVGLAVLDLYADNVTPRHPAYPVTNLTIDGSGNTTLSTTAPMAVGEKFMLYSVANGGTLISDVNDREFIVTSTAVGQITALVTVGSAPAAVVSEPVTGYLVPQYQYQFCQIQVPFNAIPTITFPTPEWSPSTITVPYTYITVPRNTSISLVINPSGSVPYPVTVTGINDSDDAPTYLWEQLTGTVVLTDPVLPPQTLPNSQAKNLTFRSNGVNILGETLTFRLTVNDGVNPPVVAYFAVVVEAYNFVGSDNYKLSRGNWQEQDSITNVAVDGLGVLTVTAQNTLAVGQQVTFSGLQLATFLNGESVTIDTVSGTQFTALTSFPAYTSAADTGVATANARISQRNSGKIWGTLDQSAIYTDQAFKIKRTSILDGTDRYIVISKNTVLVYGGINPNHVLLRRLLSPISAAIVDAVHTEDDTTYVIDDLGSLYRFSTAPLINTDNPDTTIDLSLYSTMTFNKITCTYSHADVRILALSGPSGCMLMEVANDAMTVQGVLLLTTESNLVVGSDNVQFIRMSNVETLNSGKILLGTVTNVQATVTAVQVTNNALMITCLNNFQVGDIITFSGFTAGTAFLNGKTVTVVSANGNGFTASLEWPNLAQTGTAASSLAVASNDGKTYETLIDMGTRQIIGTWDASKLKNQFVQTGEILFEPDSSYSGRPTPPVLATPTHSIVNNTTVATLAWTQQRPDLVSQYNIEYAAQVSQQYVLDGSQVITIATSFGTDQGVVDQTTSTPLVKVTTNPGPGQYSLTFSGSTAIYSFNAAQVGDTLAVLYLTPYTVLQIVTSGNIQTVTFPLLPGQYSFRMQAVGLDGTSDYSNVQTISF